MRKNDEVSDSEELEKVAAGLRSLSAVGDDVVAGEKLTRLADAAAEVGRSWSGSSLGYHSCVYYAGLAQPPPGSHFSQEWGLQGMFQGSTGDWRECRYGDVYDHIIESAGVDIAPIETKAADAVRPVEEARSAIESILTTWLDEHPNDSYLSRLKDRMSGVVVFTAARATELQISSGQVITRDSTAVGQGLRAAPHQAVIGRVVACKSPYQAARELADLATAAAAHIGRLERRQRRELARTSGTFVFIGHGRSPFWRELKDFVEDRLGLGADEFNRVPIAGVTNIDRLVQMLDEAAVALLVLTAEDERADGTTAARQNVVHEAGLFQGRLGFSRAIVLLEEGCEEFSNINGLGQIRFPPGNIAAAFEEIRRVLEREELI